MNKYYVKYRFDTLENVEFEDVMADSEESAVRKTSIEIFNDGYFNESLIRDIVVERRY